MSGARIVLAILALCTVAPLLAWVTGLGRFAIWYFGLTVPALVLVAAAAWWSGRKGRSAQLHDLFICGAVGGALGLAAYDVVRLPLVAAGYRVLAPIDSYGVLLTGADGSSSVTGIAGWFFHASNGVCFGVAYALLFGGMRWWWGVVFAMVLETATIVTAYADFYGLSGNYPIIASAYAAHFAYGTPLGLLCAHPERTAARVRAIVPHAAVYLLAAVVAAIMLWQRPWATQPHVERGEAVAPGPSAIVQNSRFSPEWIRVPVGACVAFRNEDDVERTVKEVKIAPGGTGQVCFAEKGVKRVKIGGPYTGGFVIVDSANRN